jgi:hypothetical protein
MEKWNMQDDGGWTWENVLNTYTSLENFIPDDVKSLQTASKSRYEIPYYHGDGSGVYSVTSTRYF